MLSISLPEQTEQNINQLAELSGLTPEDVARVLLAAAFVSTQKPGTASTSPYRTRPDLTQDEFAALINSFGTRSPKDAVIDQNVDPRDVAYPHDTE